MVLLLLSLCLKRNYDSLPIEHTTIASDGEYTLVDYILQVQLELIYPGSQFYHTAMEMEKEMVLSYY